MHKRTHEPAEWLTYSPTQRLTDWPAEAHTLTRSLFRSPKVTDGFNHSPRQTIRALRPSDPLTDYLVDWLAG